MTPGTHSWMTEMMSSWQQSARSLLMLAAGPKVMHLTGPKRVGARVWSSCRYIMASSDATPPGVRKGVQGIRCILSSHNVPPYE